MNQTRTRPAAHIIHWTPGPGDPTFLHGTIGPVLILVDFFPYRFRQNSQPWLLRIERAGDELLWEEFWNWFDLLERLADLDATIGEWTRQ